LAGELLMRLSLRELLLPANARAIGPLSDLALSDLAGLAHVVWIAFEWMLQILRNALAWSWEGVRGCENRPSRVHKDQRESWWDRKHIRKTHTEMVEQTSQSHAFTPDGYIR
jgi:hypothetical protein